MCYTEEFMVYICVCVIFYCKKMKCFFLCYHVFSLAETPPPAYSPQDDSLHGSESNHQSMDTATLSAGI